MPSKRNRKSARTLDNVDGAWVQDQKVTVENGSISEFEVTLKITFVLNDYSARNYNQSPI